jgi:sterol desaturase/sphingolipid hydroxylase (fatty acid hydroxylase superfamily)
MPRMLDWNSVSPALETAARLGVFAGLFAVLAVWEALAPWRPRAIALALRWSGNLGLVAVSSLLARLLIPLMPVGAAMLAAERGWGVLNALAPPPWIAGLLAFVLLDLAIYWQHRLFHAVPLLWRLHRVHHADLEFDVSTGLRFHPVEILLSLLIKVGVVMALGAPALAVLAFEIVLNATSMFTHVNVALPAPLDRALRRVIVTPAMHRVHHSVVDAEHDSNFGFNFAFWDRLFASYREAPAAGADGLTIGLDIYRAPADSRLDRLLLQPFRDPT